MKIFHIVLILIIFIFVQFNLSAQTEMQQNLTEDVPELYYDIVMVASDFEGMSRINIYVEIPYDELLFLKTEQDYRAQYEISAVIYDSDGDQIDGKVWQEEIVVDSYESTNLRKLFSFTHNHFHIAPGAYRISIGFLDLESNRKGTWKQDVQLKNFKKEVFSISDITLTDHVSVDSLGIESIRPQVASCIKTAGTELFCYFEIYSQSNKNEDISIDYLIRNNKQKVIEKQHYVRKRDAERTLEFFKIDKQKLSHGKFTIELKISQGRYEDEVKKPFLIRWMSVPSTVVDLDLATDQLKYIATNDEIKKIKKTVKSEQIEEFEKFWKTKDPTPGTSENELLKEYYRRIEYSNLNFSTYREGWKTDMGMIYIIFGSPSDIERHPFERGYKPYEVWFYYHVNRQFLFIDESGFGEYRLSNPIWRDWNQNGIYF